MAEAKTNKTTTKKAEPKKAEVKEENVEVVETVVNTDKTAENIEPKIDERDIKLAEQQVELEALKAQMQAILQAQMINTTNVVPTKKKKNISIVSLTVGGLNLMGTRPIRIEKQFEAVSVSEAEATAIVTNMPNAARSGLFYILDAEFVEENELSDAYQNILDDKQFKQLLNQSSDYVVDIFKSASDAQKQIIISMIIDKKSHNQPVDANIVEQISKLSGVDFNMAEEVKDEENE
jgi:hypothetical protein